MIVKIPFEGGLPIALSEGEKLTIRVFSGVTVCSFACTVERVFARPLFYAHVSQPGNHQVIVNTRASIKNVNVIKPSPAQYEVFTYGVQFIDLEPSHYTLLQNLTYEALIADRQKIV
jgi:hypothetical protein